MHAMFRRNASGGVECELMGGGGRLFWVNLSFSAFRNNIFTFKKMFMFLKFKIIYGGFKNHFYILYFEFLSTSLPHRINICWIVLIFVGVENISHIV